jgi:NAD(P)H-dependent FMN reductase
MPIKVVAITGSLRKASVNAGLLRAAAALAPKHNMEFNIISADLPLFNQDLEAGGAAGELQKFLAFLMMMSSYHGMPRQVYPSL